MTMNLQEKNGQEQDTQVTDKTVARNVGEEGKHTLRVLGHNLYVRKCVVPDITDEAGKIVVALCEQTKDRTNWAEVVAVGPKVGQRRNGNKRDLKAKDLARWANMQIKPGDFVVLPESSKRNMMWRGGLGEESELVVYESELIAMIPAEEIED